MQERACRMILLCRNIDMVLNPKRIMISGLEIRLLPNNENINSNKQCSQLDKLKDAVIKNRLRFCFQFK